MKIEDIRPRVRFADKMEYTGVRPLSKTYDSRLLYITDGAGTITVGGVSTAVGKGLLVLFSGGVAYKFEPKPSFCAYAVDFDLCGEYECDGFILPVPVSSFNAKRLHACPSFDDSELFKNPFVAHVHAGIGEDIRKIAEEYNSGRLYAKRRAELMLGGVFLELARSLSQKSKGARCVGRVLGYIADHYREPLSNAALAALFGHEPCYLNRTVKLHTGSSIHRLLNKKRVEEGIKLLLSTDLLLDEIAERVGFCSASHFSKRCRDITGNNPSFYRK